MNESMFLMRRWQILLLENVGNSTRDERVTLTFNID